MNPSSSGWIDKYIFILGKSKANFPFKSEPDFYENLRKNGFIYGFSVNTLIRFEKFSVELTKEEIAKVNLLQAFFFIYFKHFPNSDYTECITHLNLFYSKLNEQKRSFLPNFNYKSGESKKLELTLAKRIEKSKSIEKQNFDHIMTNALLFLDVLAFQKFIDTNQELNEYPQKLEATLLQTCFFGLLTKTKKTTYDLLIIEMFEASTLYSKYFKNSKSALKHSDFSLFTDTLEKYYILDLATLAVWSDLQLELPEKDFLDNLCLELMLDKSEATNSIENLKNFVETNKSSINLFQYTHPVKQFYKQSSKLVKLLILRNKNRLGKELSQSKELMRLLGKSTFTELSNEEKNVVKEQLYDIFKTIPSLTIFMLPGGTLLLPLLIKFIPQLLPSAFDDNKIPKK
ncbi:MAG: LETM1-related biofilm-associated protein [Flavobacteriaceae bacterium]